MLAAFSKEFRGWVMKRMYAVIKTKVKLVMIKGVP